MRTLRNYVALLLIAGEVLLGRAGEALQALQGALAVARVGQGPGSSASTCGTAAAGASNAAAASCFERQRARAAAVGARRFYFGEAPHADELGRVVRQRRGVGGWGG